MTDMPNHHERADPDIADPPWCVYAWMSNMDSKYIHPEDLSVMREVEGGARLWKCVGVDEIYITLECPLATVRVTPEPHLLMPVAAPEFDYGEEVLFQTNGRLQVGVVTSITWHRKQSEPLYLLSVNGKPKKKRYWARDLRHA